MITSCRHSTCPVPAKSVCFHPARVRPSNILSQPEPSKGAGGFSSAPAGSTSAGGGVGAGGVSAVVEEGIGVEATGGISSLVAHELTRVSDDTKTKRTRMFAIIHLIIGAR